MSAYQIKVEDKPAPEDIQVLRRGLSEFNAAQTGQRGQLISVLVRDHQGQIVGGASGWTAFGLLHVDVLWLNEDIRRKGFGSRVLQAAEAEARERVVSARSWKPSASKRWSFIKRTDIQCSLS